MCKTHIFPDGDVEMGQHILALSLTDLMWESLIRSSGNIWFSLTLKKKTTFLNPVIFLIKFDQNSV